VRRRKSAAAALFVLLAGALPAWGDDLEEICRQVGGAVVRGKFEQRRVIKRMGRVMVSSGRFVISPEDGMVWNTDSPFPSTLVMGLDFMVQSTPEGGKMWVEGNDVFMQIAGIMGAVFGGDAEALRAGFEVRLWGDTAAWEMELLPRDSSLREVMGRLVLAGGEFIDRLSMYPPNGDAVVYLLSGQEKTEALQADEKTLFYSE